MPLPKDLTREEAGQRMVRLYQTTCLTAFNEPDAERKERLQQEMIELETWIIGYDAAAKALGPEELHPDVQKIANAFDDYTETYWEFNIAAPGTSRNSLIEARRRCENYMRKVSAKLRALDELNKPTEEDKG